MLTKDRSRLVRQALDTLYRNTRGEFTLTLVDDGGTETPYAEYLSKPNIAVLKNVTSKGITARVRNLAVHWSNVCFGRGDWLCLADNDLYFCPGWDEQIIRVAHEAGRVGAVLVGGQNHPYHGMVGESDGWREYLALAGSHWFMRWEVWDNFGPLKEGAPGPCNGEDDKFCEGIRKVGLKVGACWPEVVIDCGITQTGGKDAPGADLKMKNRKAGVIYE